MRLVRPVFLAIALIVCAMPVFVGCGKSQAASSATAAGEASAPTTAATTAAITPASTPRAAAPPAKPVDPLVVLHTTAGDITLRLLAEKAPRTVENFLRNYAERGFYEQTIFHHVEPGVMLIGGGYTADLQPKPTRAAIYNESNSGLSNRRGTIAMVHDPDSPHSATSQFFFNLADNPDLDFKRDDTDDVPGYAVFGEVVTGMDVVDRIAQLTTASQGDFTSVPSPIVLTRSVDRTQ
jgi:peptidyl-prolyl cis-trans isomerase A (cyclophilin A)